MSMLYRFGLPLCALMFVASACSAPPPSPEISEAAGEAAAAWLELVDAGAYEESWEAAAGLFRRSISKEEWVRQLEAARTPLGALSARDRQREAYHTSLPGAPDGEYVIITYKTAFEKKGSAAETVTPMRDPDGEWRVSGYYIR